MRALRLLPPLLLVLVLALWGWLAIARTAVLVWPGAAEDGALSCHYASAQDLLELRFAESRDGVTGRKACPPIVPAP